MNCHRLFNLALCILFIVKASDVDGWKNLINKLIKYTERWEQSGDKAVLSYGRITSGNGDKDWVLQITEERLQNLISIKWALQMRSKSVTVSGR